MVPTWPRAKAMLTRNVVGFFITSHTYKDVFRELLFEDRLFPGGHSYGSSWSDWCINVN